MLTLIIFSIMDNFYFILYVLGLFPNCLSMFYFYNKKKHIIKIILCNRIKANHFILTHFWSFKKISWGFPGASVVENLPANAGDTGSSPSLGRSHLPRSNQAREPQLLSLHVWSLCPATREAATVRGPRTAMKSGPHLPQLEIGRAHV